MRNMYDMDAGKFYMIDNSIEILGFEVGVNHVSRLFKASQHRY